MTDREPDAQPDETPSATAESTTSPSSTTAGSKRASIEASPDGSSRDSETDTNTTESAATGSASEGADTDVTQSSSESVTASGPSADPGTSVESEPGPASESSTSAKAGSATETSGSDTAQVAADPDTPGKLSRLPKLRKPSFGRAGRITTRAVAALVVGAAVGSSIFLYFQNQDKQELLDAREQARKAACDYGPVLSTYDAKNLDQYVKAVLDGATGDWKKQFESTSKDLGDVLSKGEVVAKTDDVQCAVRTADKTSAEAIVVMGQTITSLGTKGQPEKGQLSVVMRLQKDGDRWLTDKIETPLAPPQP